MTQVCYVGPFDAVEVQVGVDEFDEPVWDVAERDVPIEVADTIAGHAPSAEYLQAHDDIGVLHPVTQTPNVPVDELIAAQEQLAEAHSARVNADPGAGLLAQPDNWQPATYAQAAASKAADAERLAAGQAAEAEAERVAAEQAADAERAAAEQAAPTTGGNP